MNKLKYLLMYGIKKRMFKKSFLIANIIILLLTLVIINIPTIISFVDAQDNQPYQIVMITDEETAYFNASIDDILNQGLDSDAFVISSSETFDETNFYAQTDIDMAIVLAVIEEQLLIDIYRFDTSYDTIIMNTLQLIDTFRQAENYVYPQVNLNVPEDYVDPQIQEIMSSVSVIFALPLFMILVISIQYVGVDIIEEKSSKAIETIISSVPSTTHFISKILASLAFVLIQGVLLFIYGLIGSGIDRSLEGSVAGNDVSFTALINEYIPNWPGILSISIIFILIGAVLYLVIAAIIAASATTQEDFQQFQAPIMITLVIGFYIGIFASAAQAFTVLRVAAFVPLFAPMIVPVAYASGAISALDVGVSLLVLIIFTVGIIWLIGPMYKVAILSYDRSKMFERIKSYFKKRHDL